MAVFALLPSTADDGFWRKLLFDIEFQNVCNQFKAFLTLFLLIFSGWKEEFAKKWKPKCLEELLDLPCFLILSGEDRSGETLPR